VPGHVVAVSGTSLKVQNDESGKVRVTVSDIVKSSCVVVLGRFVTLT
jgi:hypothetical protein